MVEEVRARGHSAFHYGIADNLLKTNGVSFPPLRVTIVDDNAADRYLLREALQETGVPYAMSEFGDACDAMSSLTHHFSAAHAPEVIVLDINLPKCDGFEILRVVRRNASLNNAIVIMNSSSRSYEDVRAAYDLGANVYVEKGRDLDDIFRIMAGVVRFCSMALRNVVPHGRWSPEWSNAA